jgi:hypothetical protein
VYESSACDVMFRVIGCGVISKFTFISHLLMLVCCFFLTHGDGGGGYVLFLLYILVNLTVS